jgi:GT2 family glycosyltransferase
MTLEPKVTAVIVNWNGLKDTIECIESLMKIDYSNYDIIVIDNGSLTEEEPRKLKETFDSNNVRLKVVELKRNLGFANANNIGIRIALQNGAEYVLLLNNDTIVDPKFLKEMINAAKKDHKIGVLGPKMYYYDDRNRLWYAGGKVNMYFTHTQDAGKLDIGQYESTKLVDYVAGACMLIRKNVFRNIGLLPRDYFLGWEDIDFCIAAKRNGYCCMFVPNSYIWHKVSSSYRRHNLSRKMVFFGFRNRVIMRYKFLSKYGFLLFLAIHFLIVMPVHILYYIMVYKDPSRVVNMYRGLIAGIKDRRNRKIIYEID